MSEGEPLHKKGVARPIDDFESLELAQALIENYRPELSSEERLALALSTASHVKLIENHGAQIAGLAQQVNEIFE
jgi:hypothetical protein